jgi:hypothetical protein
MIRDVGAISTSYQLVQGPDVVVACPSFRRDLLHVSKKPQPNELRTC